IAKDYGEAAQIALRAGVDVDLPEGAGFRTLTEAVTSGRVPMAAIDQAVSRFLTMKFNAGLFENPWPNREQARRANGPEGVALARKAAEKSLVLLKNDGVLPLALPASGGAKPTIAVIGPKDRKSTRLNSSHVKIS